MQPYRLAVVLIVVLATPAFASRDLSSPAGRDLLQSSDDCARSVPNCKTCRYQKFGTTTYAVCTQCTTGYITKNGGRACWCAPGYKKSGTACVPCNDNLSAGTYAYCAGSKATWDSAVATTCGANKVTATAVAKSEKECVAAPGYGWVPGDGVAAVQCDVGTYNPGMNTRKCTRCPGGLTTLSAGATSLSTCLAPIGYYYYRGKAVACAQGTFKNTTANADCLGCPTGFSTPTVASTNATACTILKAGYSAPAGAAGTAVGALCAADTFRSGDVTWDATAVTNGISCTGCPTACITNGAVGATSATMCITPPGYAWTGSICQACDAGSYNQGYNRETCTLCGTGITTDGTGTVFPDGCKIPAGYGTSRDATTGALSAAACPVNTYGRDAPTYGLVDVECTKCLDNTHTASTGSQGAAACLTNGGYGYDNGAANLCDYGFWSSGGDQAPCSYCGDGKNTSDPAAPTVPTTGGTNTSWCVTAAGWTIDGAGGIKPCTRGTYKADLGNATCTSCSTWGLTTSITYGATERESCDSCMPGYGTTYGTDSNIMANGSFISLSTAACSKCASGYYSAGGVQGGAACDRCPQSADYDNVVVSRPGSTTSDACVRQFPTGNSSLTNNLQWDILPMAATALAVQSAATDIQTCQSGCQGDATCQYFVFYSYNTSCYYRKAATDIIKITADVTNPGTAFYVMFDVKDGQYVAYTATDATDAGAIGTTISTYNTFAAAKTACDASAACAGFANTDASTWRTFSGSKWEGGVGKVRAVGEAINSWIA